MERYAAPPLSVPAASHILGSRRDCRGWLEYLTGFHPTLQCGCYFLDLTDEDTRGSERKCGTVASTEGRESHGVTPARSTSTPPSDGARETLAPAEKQTQTLHIRGCKREPLVPGKLEAQSRKGRV